jgi:YgiT-type zinc finger domain-containing protein
MNRCFVCGHNVIVPGMTSKMFDEEGNIVIVKEIPCLVCENCGEIYLQTEVILNLEKILSVNKSELEIINYGKVA